MVKELLKLAKENKKAYNKRIPQQIKPKLKSLIMEE
jgi:hypothetical protein